MSRRTAKRSCAPIFAALGDETRLALVKKLSCGHGHSISALTQGARVTRQAITKHLRTLEKAGVVHARRAGRERLFELNPAALEAGREYLSAVSRQWDEALARLKSLVEE